MGGRDEGTSYSSQLLSRTAELPACNQGPEKEGRAHHLPLWRDQVGLDWDLATKGAGKEQRRGLGQGQ